MRVNERTAQLPRKTRKLTAEVTGCKKPEPAVREADQKYRTLFHSNSTGIAITTLDGEVVDANQAYQDMVGYTLKELEDTNVRKLTPKKWHKLEAEATKHLMSEGYGIFEKEYIRKDGTVFPISLSAWLIRDGQGNPAGIGAFVKDITDRKKAEPAVQEADQKYRTPFHSNSTGIAITTLDGEVVDANQAYQDMVGYTLKELSGTNIRKLTPKKWHKLEAEVTKHLMSEGYGTFEKEYIRKDRTIFPVSLSAWLIRDRQGNPAGIGAFVKDTAQHQQPEKTLRQADTRYKALFDRTLYCVYVHDLEGRFLDANDAALNLLGYTREELTSISVSSLLGEDQLPTARKALEEIKQTGRQKRITEYKLTTKDGDYVWVETEASLIYRQGKPYAIQGIARDITERKRAEEALRETNARYNALFDRTLYCIYVHDLEGSFLDANDAALNLLGYTREELPSINISSLLGEDQLLTALKTLEEIQQTGRQKGTTEYKLTTKDGDYVWVETEASLVYRQGKPYAIQGIATDITERKKAEEDIKQARDDYRTITNLTGDIIIHIDRKGRWTFLNDGACKFWGKPRKELLGLKFIDYTHPDDAEKIAAVIQEMAKIKQMAKGMTTRQETPKGWRIVEWNAVPLLDETENYAGMQATGRDITERKQAEEALQESGEKLRAMFESVTDGIAIVDLEGKVVDVNEAQLRIFGYGSKEAVIGQNAFDSVDEKDRAKAVEGMGRALEGKLAAPAEYTLLAKDGREFEAEITVSLLNDNSANPAGLVCVIRDITERKQAEKALQEAKTHFEELFETANELIITTDGEGWILRLNKEVEKLSGYSKKELIGKSILEIAYPEDRDKYVQFWQDILSGLSPHYELRTISKTGDVRYLLASGNAIKKDGNIVEIQYNAKDITEEKQVEEKLRESEGKYRTILENVTEGYYEIDLAGNLAFFNDSLCRTMGYTRDEMLGMNNRQYMDEENTAKVYQIFNEVYRTGKPYARADWEVIRKDGTKLSISSSVSLIRDPQGQPIGFRGLSRDITEQKKAAEELRKSEEKYRTILENVVEGYYEVDLAGSFTFVNDSICHNLGYTRDELIGMNNRNYMDKQTAKKVLEKFGEVYTTGQPARGFEFEIIRKDGTKLFLSSSVSLITDPQGQPTGFRGVVRDITEEKKAEEALRQSEEEYRNLFESATDAVYTTDMRGRFTSGNRKAEEICGYNREELIGKSFISLISRKEVPRLENIFQEIIKGKPATFEVDIKDKSGNLIPLEISATSIVRKGGETVGMLAMARDITERKQAQEKLQKSEERYRSLFESATDGIFTMDSQTRFTSGNKKAEEMCGYSRDELTGEYATLILPEEEIPRMADALKKVLRGETDTYETKIINKNGDLLPVEVTSSPIEIDGKIIGTMGMARDITERKKAEEALRQSEGKYRTILESMTEGYYEVDIAGNFTFFNDALCQILGYTGDEMMGMNNRQYMDKKNARKVYQEFNKVYRTGEPSSGFDWQFIGKDGTKRFVETSVSLMRNREGKPTGFRGIFRDITERKQAEQTLQESEEKYRDLTENINDAIYTVDKDGNVTYVSPVIEWLTGYSPSGMIGRSFAELLHEEDLPHAIESFERTVSGHSTEGEYRFYIKSGEIRWMKSSNRPIFAGDRVVGARGTLTDITERKLAEIASEEARTRFEDLFETANELILTTDTEGWLLHVNKEVERFSGYSKKELIGQSILKIAYPEDTPKYIQFWKDILDGLTPRYHLRGFSKTGNISHLLASASVVKKDGKIVEIQYNAKDITEEKQAEEKLRESEKKYRTILENMADGYYEVDLAGNLTFFNDAMCQIVGYTRDKMMGMNNRKYMDKESARKVYQTFNKVYTTGKPARGFDWEMIRKDGTKRFVEASTSLIRDSEDKPIGFRGIVRDTTDRKQMEAEKEEMEQRAQLASRLSIVGEMASGIVHEVNNPLTSVVGFAEILAQSDLPEDAREYARIINTEGKRVANIAGRLLNFARHQKAQTVYTDINELIKGTLELQTYEMTTGNIKITTKFDPHLPQTMADPGQLQQVFLNIMLNARTEMRTAHGGGRLSVKTQALDDTIQIFFKDDGPGIPKKNLKRIFDPFFTTRKTGEGTGLGLSICQGIINSHNGKIYARSRSDKGATFIIELPVVARQRETATTANHNANTVWR